ncbi:probable staphylococcal-like nuclease CAN2 [Phragmites australis]|uniref:probable staphylococcal-like nuclease CAN2 n=1 Tax=Phragmites australis TaxID=29695 RepID=UPI002D76CEF1|nr:probable staphylococcal-like nuclease CAN2 [Phragmites australis]
MGNILRRLFKGDGEDHHDHDGGSDHYVVIHAGESWDDQPAAASTTRRRHDQQALGPHGARPATVGVAALAHDILNFEATSTIPKGLIRHGRSSKNTQAKWYQSILEAYKNTSPPKTSAEAAQLVATALSWIQRDDLEGILAFYNLPIPSLPAASASSGHHPSSLPEGVKFVMNTLPVDNRCIGDGDGFNPYVNTTDPRESANVPLKVHEMVIARTKARAHKDYQRADALLSSIEEAGYKILTISGEEILARRYRIRMRGIDAPELNMPYGKESKNALVKLIGGRSVKIYVYEQDKYERYVGDVYCDNVFIQEQMLKCGHAHHYEAFDKRPEFAKWQREAEDARLGLWASGNPEKPWDYKRNQRRAAQAAGHVAIQVY